MVATLYKQIETTLNWEREQKRKEIKRERDKNK